MKETLAFFGAFNPPSIAHLDLAAFALRETGAKRVLFVPSRAVYIRDTQGKDFVYGDERRLEMLRRAAESRPWMEVTDLEIRQQTQPRTYDTLCRLREQGCTATLLMGSDKLTELETGWRHVEEIAREFGILVLTRGADECQRMLREDPYLASLAPWIRVIQTPEQTRNISSTRVRQLVREIRERQEQLSSMVDPAILPLLQRAEGEE